MLKKLDNIVLVADSINHTKDNVTDKSTTLEKPSLEYTKNLYNALTNFANQVIVCNSPKELAIELENKKVDVVMTIYGGEKSRNRMALVPAVCESFNVPFMGADVYNRIICQDKNLSKKIANELGIKTPNSILIEDKYDIQLINTLNLPLVIKPNFEGSSIGISNSSLVHTYDEALNTITESLKNFQQTILVEEFIPGKEVNITVVGDNENIQIFEAVEDIMLENDSFFDDNLFTLENKKLLRDKFSHKIITNELNDETKNKIKNLYKKLGKIDYIRVDGKFCNGDFILIELTPDPHLGITSGFVKALQYNNYNYIQGIELLISNTLNYYEQV